MTPNARLALVSGSTRSGSTNTAVLRTVPELLDETVRPLLLPGLAELPHFSPDDDTDPLPPAVARMRELVGEADAILFCTPEYAGALPGSFKNLLDWTVGGVEIVDKPVAWINVSTAHTGAEGAHRELRTVLTYTGARVIDEACVRVPVPRAAVDPRTGRVSDPDVRGALGRAVRALLAAAAPATPGADRPQ